APSDADTNAGIQALAGYRIRCSSSRWQRQRVTRTTAVLGRRRLFHSWARNEHCTPTRIARPRSPSWSGRSEPRVASSSSCSSSTRLACACACRRAMDLDPSARIAVIFGRELLGPVDLLAIATAQFQAAVGPVGIAEHPAVLALAVVDPGHGLAVHLDLDQVGERRRRIEKQRAADRVLDDRLNRRLQLQLVLGLIEVGEAAQRLAA